MMTPKESSLYAALRRRGERANVAFDYVTLARSSCSFWPVYDMVANMEDVFGSGYGFGAWDGPGGWQGIGPESTDRFVVHGEDAPGSLAFRAVVTVDAALTHDGAFTDTPGPYTVPVPGNYGRSRNYQHYRTWRGVTLAERAAWERERGAGRHDAYLAALHHARSEAVAAAAGDYYVRAEVFHDAIPGLVLGRESYGIRADESPHYVAEVAGEVVDAALDEARERFAAIATQVAEVAV